MQSYVNSCKELLWDFTSENRVTQWECEATKISSRHYNLTLPLKGDKKCLTRKVSVTLGENEGL